MGRRIKFLVSPSPWGLHTVHHLVFVAVANFCINESFAPWALKIIISQVMEFLNLVESLLPKAAKWESLGLQLGLSPDELATIKANSEDVEECGLTGLSSQHSRRWQQLSGPQAWRITDLPWNWNRSTACRTSEEKTRMVNNRNVY